MIVMELFMSLFKDILKRSDSVSTVDIVILAQWCSASLICAIKQSQSSMQWALFRIHICLSIDIGHKKSRSIRLCTFRALLCTRTHERFYPLKG